MMRRLSCLANAKWFKGQAGMPLSTRCYLESMDDPRWLRRRVIIDRLFWFQRDHCPSFIYDAT